MTPRRNPFREVERLFERMAQQFDETPGVWEESPLASFEEQGMNVDVEDRDDEFVVTADLPGFDKSEIDLQVTDQTLEITAEHEAEEEESTEEYIRRERQHRTMTRTVRLPEAIDAEAVTASYKNGVLTITLPKTEVTESGHHIDIE